MENKNALARVILEGDLKKLTEEQKVQYYSSLCKALKLNPFTKPFEYMDLKGKHTLYATKGCADQLRKLHGVSVQITKTWDIKGVYFVQVKATDKDGRIDMATGFANVCNFGGESLGNAMLKAETKAKRRVTLSICGLGAFLDENEVDDTPGAKKQRSKSAVNAQTTSKTTRTSEDVAKHLQLAENPVKE